MLNLKGIWIPIEILIDKNLSDKEKIIYAIILFLSQENNYCYCTNTTLSEMFYISTTQVSKLINSLKSKKYIKTEIIYKETASKLNKGNWYLYKIILIHMKEKLNTPLLENFNSLYNKS